jgi:tripartite ATP-independent transporter DctP family solute receptor
MLKKFRCLALVMALILVVVSGTTFAAKKPIKIVYGHVWETSHFFYKGDLYFKELVEKNSKGTILVEVFPASQLGSVAEQYQAVKSGAQQLTMSSIGDLVTFWPKLATFDLPYLYRDQNHLLRVAQKFAVLSGQNEMAKKTGLRVVGVRIRTPRHLTTKFPVNSLEDIKGLKIRVPQSPVSVALWKSLGAVPTVIPGAEAYTAIATGTVDAQENPFDSIYSAKFYEVTKYCALTAHKYEMVTMATNNKWWKSLTAIQRKIIQNALDKSNELMWKAASESGEEDYQKLVKLGMKFTKPDLAPFREKAKTIWDKFGDKKLIKKVEAVK